MLSVSGRLASPSHSPCLRITRAIEARMVFSVEPGIFFIEMLLREKREGADANLFDWAQIDRLALFGGGVSRVRRVQRVGSLERSRPPGPARARARLSPS